MTARRNAAVKTKRLLDSYAVLAYLNGEAAAEAVAQAMKDVEDSGSSLLMSEINIGEVHYILTLQRYLIISIKFA
jgi:PIN domain nuclease of toxin-antitoxin system